MNILFIVTEVIKYLFLLSVFILIFNLIDLIWSFVKNWLKIFYSVSKVLSSVCFFIIMLLLYRANLNGNVNEETINSFLNNKEFSQYIAVFLALIMLIVVPLIVRNVSYNYKPTSIKEIINDPECNYLIMAPCEGKLISVNGYDGKYINVGDVVAVVEDTEGNQIQVTSKKEGWIKWAWRTSEYLDDLDNMDYPEYVDEDICLYGIKQNK